MVPVSSTVIPIPVYKVEYGLGFLSKDKKAQLSYKPEGGVKLITSKKQFPFPVHSCIMRGLKKSKNKHCFLQFRKIKKRKRKVTANKLPAGELYPIGRR